MSGVTDAKENGVQLHVTLAGELNLGLPLYSFCSASGCTDGQDPSAALVQGSDGNFYATCVPKTAKPKSPKSLDTADLVRDVVTI